MNIRCLCMVLWMGGCTAPEMSRAFTQVDMIVTTADEADQTVADALDAATASVHLAIPAGVDVRVPEAALRAWERGLEVEVVTDIDQADDPGIATLLQAGMAVTLADDELTYFDFNINQDVTYSSNSAKMTHAFAVVDRTTVWQLSGMGYGAGDSPVVQFKVTGEDLVEDMLTEHNQVYGGADAVATTAYDGMAKSIADLRWRYPTQTDLDLEVWFSPQERAVKRVTDAIYGARGNVRIMTDDLSDEGIIRALQAKAADGFKMQVVVGSGFTSISQSPQRLFEDATPGVGKRRASGIADLPTVVIIDDLPGIDGKRYTTRAFMISHDLYSAARLYNDQPLTNDQLLDGAEFILVDYDEPSPEIQTLVELWTNVFEQGVAL